MADNMIDVSNQALEQLGKNVIVSLTEGSVEAKRCARHGSPARRLALMQSPWTFARKIQPMSLNVENLRSDVWEYSYDVPRDCLKIAKLLEEGQRYSDNLPPVDMELADGKLYTNAARAALAYTWDNDNVASWPETFVGVVSQGLALRLAPSMTRRSSDVRDIKQAYAVTLADAIEIDAQQEVTTARFGDGYADDRGGGSTESGMWGSR